MKIIFNKNTNKDFLEDKKIVIIVAYFYKDIADMLLFGATTTLKKYGIKNDNIDILYIPGAFEVPFMAKKLAETNQYDGIVTLGAVIKGETPHFDFVCNECAKGVAKVSYDYGIPVSFGVLTTSNMAQTINRSGGNKGNKGEEATIAMIEMLYLIKSL